MTIYSFYRLQEVAVRTKLATSMATESTVSKSSWRPTFWMAPMKGLRTPELFFTWS